MPRCSCCGLVLTSNKKCQNCGEEVPIGTTVTVIVGDEDKERSEVIFARGREFHKKKEYDNAIKEYSEALLLDPTNTQAFRFRGEILYSIGQYGKAIDDYSNGQSNC